MTFEEAKKILESEGFVPERFLGVLVEDVKAALWEKIEVGEAMKVVAENGYFPFMEKSKYEERKARLKKEYEKNTKAPGPGEEQPKEGNLKAATKMFGAQAREIMRLTAENAELRETIDKMKEGNPALKEAATQFNDALLNEQAKKIAELTKEKANLEDQITVLNACKKHNDKIDRKQIKCLGKEIAKLNGIIHDKNAVLADVAEELRLSKIREKNLTELCQKYVKANEELKEKLANKGVDEINAQALKSAESALAYKDEVIETLDKELAEAKHELSSLKRPFRPDSTEAVVLFANAYAKAEKKHLRCAEWRNDGKEVSITYILKNGKKSKITLDFTGDEIIFSRTDPDKKPRIPTPEEPKHDNAFEDFINKTIDNYNRRVAELGCAGSKDGNGIFNQMIGVDIAEEGGDHSAIIAQCCKNIAISKDEAEIIERCTKNGTELHYSEKDGFTYTNMYGEEMPIKCLRGLFHVFTDEELKKMKK